MSHSRLITLFGIVAFIILIVYGASLINADIRFTQPCRFFSQREWTFLRSGPDVFEVHLTDRRDVDRNQIDLFHIERGDMVRVTLAEGITPGEQVYPDQIVAHLDSRENQRRLDQYQPQLIEANAELRQAQTGAKEEIIAQARSTVDAARARRQIAESSYERAETLRRDGLLSDAEYEQFEAERNVAYAELSEAESNLLAVETGEKSTVIDAWQARVDLLRQQVTEAESRVAAGQIHCPIAGEIVTLQGDTVLVRIADIDTLYAIAPVSPSRVGRLTVGQRAVISIPGRIGSGITGRLVHVDQQATNCGGRCLFWATVAVPNDERLLAPSGTGQVRFFGENVSLLTWVMDLFANASDQTIGG
jgi:multidrug efflux pump subunit AcrA (membrane-fusion protein)